MGTTGRRKDVRYSFSNDTGVHVDDQITAVLNEMTTVGVHSDEYQKLLSLLERLNELKTQHRRERLSRDMIAQIFGNLAGILIIVAYEQKHVWRSAAVPRILQPKKT
jgi:hypothetical protein